MLHLILKTKRLEPLKDFYAKLFEIPDDVKTLWSEYAADIPVNERTCLRFRASASAYGNIEMTFSSFDVYQLHHRIKSVIPEHAGTVDDLPCEMYCGPHEYPGGSALSLRDPDGNVLSFMEW